MEIVFIFSEVLQVLILIDIISSWVAPTSKIIQDYVKPITEPIYAFVWIVVPEQIGFFNLRPLFAILLLQLIDWILRSLI